MNVLERCTEDSRVRRLDWSDLRRRASELLPRDRALFESIAAGHSQRQLAALMGLTAGALSRRIRRLKARLYSPLVRTLTDSTDLPPLHRQIGLQYHLHDRSIRSLCREHGQTIYEIRAILTFIEGWMRGRSRAAG